jgi:hypothetical protein
MDLTKILGMIVENSNFLDLLNFLHMSPKTMPKSFEFMCKKENCTHVFNMAKNWDYEGSYPEPTFYEADCMPGDVRAQLWNGLESKKTKFSTIKNSSWPTAVTSMY